jgi:hypothetical protein
MTTATGGPATETVRNFADLLDDRSYHIEFNGHLTNHVKHAVVAMAAIGAPEPVIRGYYNDYVALTPYGYPLEPPRQSSQRVDAANWRDFLGQRAHFSAYCAFFDAEVSRLGIAGAMSAYAPELLRGWIGAFTHAAIHLGWAVWAGHAGMTAEALAYLSFSFVPVFGEHQPAAESAGVDPTDSLARLGARWTGDPVLRERVTAVISDTDSATQLHPELNRSGLQARVAEVAFAGIPELVDTPAWLASLPAAQRREQVRRAITLLYLANPGDFVILHLITSLFAIEVIADRLDAEAADEVYRLYWAGARIITAAESKIPTAHKLRALHELYTDRNDDASPRTLDEFDITARRAWLEGEEHNPKLVFVSRAWWNTNSWTAYRHAAAQFTRTPELPPSFAEPPTE